MDSNKHLENSLRKFTLDKLRALAAILALEVEMMSTTTISGALNKEDEELGARISSLARTKIDGMQLLVPSGRNGEGTHWRLNTEIAPKEIIQSIVEEILKENQISGLKLARS